MGLFEELDVQYKTGDIVTLKYTHTQYPLFLGMVKENIENMPKLCVCTVPQADVGELVLDLITKCKVKVFHDSAKETLDVKVDKHEKHVTLTLDTKLLQNSFVLSKLEISDTSIYLYNGNNIFKCQNGTWIRVDKKYKELRFTTIQDMPDGLQNPERQDGNQQYAKIVYNSLLALLDNETNKTINIHISAINISKPIIGIGFYLRDNKHVMQALILDDIIFVDDNTQSFESDIVTGYRFIRATQEQANLRISISKQTGTIKLFVGNNKITDTEIPGTFFYEIEPNTVIYRSNTSIKNSYYYTSDYMWHLGKDIIRPNRKSSIVKWSGLSENPKPQILEAHPKK